MKKVLITLQTIVLVALIGAISFGCYYLHQFLNPIDYKSKIHLNYVYEDEIQKVDIINHAVSIVTNLGYTVDKIYDDFDVNPQNTNKIINVIGKKK